MRPHYIDAANVRAALRAALRGCRAYAQSNPFRTPEELAAAARHWYRR